MSRVTSYWTHEDTVITSSEADDTPTHRAPPPPTQSPSSSYRTRHTPTQWPPLSTSPSHGTTQQRLGSFLYSLQNKQRHTDTRPSVSPMGLLTEVKAAAAAETSRVPSNQRDGNSPGDKHVPQLNWPERQRKKLIYCNVQKEDKIVLNVSCNCSNVTYMTGAIFWIIANLGELC